MTASLSKHAPLPLHAALRAGVAEAWAQMGVTASIGLGSAAVQDAHPLWPGERTDGMAPRRAAEFAAGRAAARAALCALGEPPVALLRAASGAALWPAGRVGAITHAGGVALAVCAQGLDGIGLDLEPARPLDPAIARAITRPNDQVEGAVFDSGLALFCAKEAAFKAQPPQGPRVRFAFDLEVRLTGARFLARACAEAPWISGRILYRFDHLIAVACSETPQG